MVMLSQKSRKVGHKGCWRVGLLMAWMLMGRGRGGCRKNGGRHEPLLYYLIRRRQD